MAMEGLSKSPGQNTSNVKPVSLNKSLEQDPPPALPEAVFCPIFKFTFRNIEITIDIPKNIL